MSRWLAALLCLVALAGEPVRSGPFDPAVKLDTSQVRYAEPDIYQMIVFGFLRAADDWLEWRRQHEVMPL